MLRNTLIMSLTTLLIGLTGFTAVATATTIQVEAEFKMSGDTTRDIEDEELKASGWTMTEKIDETIYSKSISIDSGKLPYKTNIGDGYLAISKSGLITIGMSVGDDDAGADASLQWPVEKKKLVVIERPLILSSNGGDNASGAWSFDGKAIINVVE